MQIRDFILQKMRKEPEIRKGGPINDPPTIFEIFRKRLHNKMINNIHFFAPK